jgi:glycerate 2-kinase
VNDSNIRERARSIFAKAVADCSVENAFARRLKTLQLSGAVQLQIDEDVIDLTGLKRVRIVAAGKASIAMLEALLPRLRLPSTCELSGVLIARERPTRLPAGFQFFAGGHPLPNSDSFAGARAALDLVQSLPRGERAREENLCIFLISGGASAMMELPLDATITLEDTIAFHRELVHSGATIAEINCIRKHFSAVKGGRLAIAAHGAQTISLLVSDVPPGHLDALASGPTLYDTSTVAECHAIIASYRLLERFPTSVQRFFQASDLPETPKPGELKQSAWTLLDADQLAAAAQRHAIEMGYYVVIDNSCDDWDYQEAAHYLLDRLRLLRQEHPRVCLISAGEVSVRLPEQNGVTSNSGGDNNNRQVGVGGRNQQFALYMATLLKPSDRAIAVLSAGSDGIDGNSDAAGAIVDEQTLEAEFTPGNQVNWRRTQALKALIDFNSSSVLAEAHATITTGATGNNLRDLRILLSEQ